MGVQDGWNTSSRVHSRKRIQGADARKRGADCKEENEKERCLPWLKPYVTFFTDPVLCLVRIAP